MHVCKDEWCLLSSNVLLLIFLPIYWFKNSVSMLSVQARGGGGSIFVSLSLFKAQMLSGTCI